MTRASSRILRYAFLLAGAAVSASPPAVLGQIATTLEASVGGLSRPYFGTTITIDGLLRYSGDPCPTGPLPRVPGLLTVRQDGMALHSAPLYLAFDRSCANGNYTAGGSVFFEQPRMLEFGTHTFTLDYSGGEGFLPSVAPPVTFTILPQASDASPAGDGTINVGIAQRGSWYCFTRGASVAYPATIPAPPPGVRFPYGAVRYDAESCFYECGFLCPPGTPTIPQQRLVVEYPQPIAASATFWELRAGTWERASDATSSDRRARLVVSGADGSREVRGMVALGVADAASARPEVQDLWWAGEAENGWGMGIAQRGDRLFAVLYIYDDQGAAQWVVMPSGNWNSAGTHWEGPLYRPEGAWFPQHEAASLRMGAPVGTARLSFAGAFNGTLEYTIGAASGRKSIRRQVFAPNGAATPGPRAGLWWGGPAESGWGLHIAHQESTLFAVWYTYDRQGRPAWYFMSGGQWLSPERYSGTLFSARASAWAGVPYDPARLAVTAVGSMTLNFSGPDTARLEYVVDGLAGSEALTRQPF